MSTDNLKHWVTFVGEGRSGHTVLSAIIGSHPNARISEEQKYIGKWYRNGWGKKEIIKALFNSGEGRARAQMQFPGILSYKDPLLLIGDKCGWDAVNEYAKRKAPSDIIKKFGESMQLPVKVIVTIRHPFDNIASWGTGAKYQRMYGENDLMIRRLSSRYRNFYDNALDVIKDTDYFIVNHEDLIARPNLLIQEMSDWLGLPSNREWRRLSGSKIFTRPNSKRDQLVWPKEPYDKLIRFINENPLMEYYREK